MCVRLGIIGHAMGSFRGVLTIAMAAPDLPRDQMATVIEPNFTFIVPSMYAHLLGPLLLTPALWRARLVPLWPAR